MKYYVTKWNKDLINIYYIYKVDENDNIYTYWSNGNWVESVDKMRRDEHINGEIIEVSESDVMLAML